MNITEAKEHIEDLKAIKDVLQVKLEGNEIEELIENLGGADFTITLAGNEYRFINEDNIEAIYEDAIREIVEECYLAAGTKEMPWWIAIDWTQTAQNCLCDGYGHTFSSYDGSEEEAAGYYIFRTN